MERYLTSLLNNYCKHVTIEVSSKETPISTSFHYNGTKTTPQLILGQANHCGLTGYIINVQPNEQYYYEDRKWCLRQKNHIDTILNYDRK